MFHTSHGSEGRFTPSRFGLATVVALFSLLPAVVSTGAVAEEPPVVDAGEGGITAVTVYADRAEVTRVAAVKVPGGASRVEFRRVPRGVDPDSVRVTARGVPATLGAIDVDDHAEAPIETPAYLAARDEVRRLERALAEVREAQWVDARLADYLVGLGKQTRGSTDDGAFDPDDVERVYDVLERKLRPLRSQGIARGEQARDLEEELVLARAKMAQLAPSSGVIHRVVRAGVEAERAGDLEVELTYVVSGASWHPSYRATLDEDDGTVGLVSEGVVRQQTGEDWNGVELSLSTATPSQGVDPPKLDPWFLRPGVPVRDGPVPRSYQNVLRFEPGITGEPEPDDELESDTLNETVEVVPSNRMDVRIDRTLYNVSFRVPDRSDVPSEPGAQRVVLRRAELDAEVVHRTVPGLEDRAYLTALTTSPDEYPLLPGAVRVYAGGSYLGAFRLEAKAPGVELRLPFGVDNRVEILRVPEPDSAGRRGIVGKTVRVERYERTIVHNHADRAVTLVLEDRVPVSEDQRIDVTMGDDTTPGSEDSERRPGVKRWTLALEPGEKREIVLHYTVRYPRDLPVYLP